MEFDTPARIAILGAGPIGIETALYARYLGYDVDLYDRNGVAANVKKWGHITLFTPFRMNSSTLGLAALAAQDPQYQPPQPEDLLTGNNWANRYLIPLANTDLVRKSLRLNTSVLQVGRAGLLKGDAPGSQDRGEASFRLLVQSEDSERIETADIVIDATGTFGNANPIGDGGIHAIGEQAAKNEIRYDLPDIAGKDRETYIGRHTLVVGSGYSAATNIVALAELANQNADTKITWLVRRSGNGEPIQRIADDRLSGRNSLANTANELARGDSVVQLLEETRVDSITQNQGGGFFISTVGKVETKFDVDNIISNTGYRGDASIYRELQVHECYASGGPMKLAAALMSGASADCLDQVSHGAVALASPEPNFYILGSKSYGRNSNFLFAVGLQQIRDLFSGIADREGLDLYASCASTAAKGADQ